MPTDRASGQYVRRLPHRHPASFPPGHFARPADPSRPPRPPPLPGARNRPPPWHRDWRRSRDSRRHVFAESWTIPTWPRPRESPARHRVPQPKEWLPKHGLRPTSCPSHHPKLPRRGPSVAGGWSFFPDAQRDDESPAPLEALRQEIGWWPRLRPIQRSAPGSPPASSASLE